jgi:hypothetical protein
MKTAELPRQVLEMRVDESAVVERAVDGAAEVADATGQLATKFPMLELVALSSRERSRLHARLPPRLEQPVRPSFEMARMTRRKLRERRPEVHRSDGRAVHVDPLRRRSISHSSRR